ncbi:TonB-dependent receptor [Peredibacter sp. HCB2-198]|uniref:TonB-dependent receptor n=1 Tax=Peredibacter sp. HCB2-198 TaxID=3383025 RepID=UPI0038B6163D
MLKYPLSLLALIVTVSAYGATELDVIEVTELQGDKEDKTYIETNESISVLKQKNLNRGDTQNSVQMLTGLSNVQASSKNDESFSIRGISDMGVTGFQKDNLASIMVDDVFQTPIALKAGSFEQWDLNSIEVYRGAQSTTQGVNSLAGTILLYHNKPTEDNGGAAKATFGSYGRKEAAATINQKLGEKFIFRAAYNKELYNGYIKNATTGNDKWGAKNKDHFVTDFLYKLSANDELRLNLKFLRFNRGGDYVQGSNYQDYKVYEDQDFKSISNNKQGSISWDKRIGEKADNRLVLGFSKGDNNTFSDADGTDQNTAGERDENSKDSYVSLENIFKYTGKKFKNSLGFHFHRYQLDEFYDFNLLLPLSPVTSTPVAVAQNNEKTRNVNSIFDSFVYEFDERNSINIGGRLEVVENKFGAGLSGRRLQDLGPGNNAAVDSFINGLQGDYKDTAYNTVLLPKLGYNYKVGKHSMGAFYSEGYRTGGLSINRLKANISQYDPERTRNYEVSYKHMSEKFLFTTNVFYTKWLDQQVEARLSAHPYDTQVKNASTSELYGAEVEGNLEINESDSLRLNLGTVETHFLGFKNNGISYAGNSFPDAAKFTGQFSYWKGMTDEWMLIFAARYLSPSYSDPENTREVPEQFYFDVNTQYFWKEFIIEGFVRNLFDQHYRIYDGKPRTTNTPYQASYHRMSTPRELGVRVNYFW